MAPELAVDRLCRRPNECWKPEEHSICAIEAWEGQERVVCGVAGVPGRNITLGCQFEERPGLGAAVLELEGVTELACRPESSAAHAAD